MSAPRAKEICANPPEQPTLDELHKRFGTSNDDELILRALVPSSEVDKAYAAGPVKTSFPTLSSPELDQVRRLMKLANSPVVQLSSPDLKLSLRKFR